MVAAVHGPGGHVSQVELVDSGTGAPDTTAR